MKFFWFWQSHVCCLNWELFLFFSWVIFLTEMMSWEFIILIFTVMKMAPFMMMNIISTFYSVIWLSVIGMMVSIGSIFTNSIRKIMAFSSIDHTSWMIIALMTSKWSFIYYYFIYLIVLLTFMKIMNITNLFSLKNVVFSKSKSITLLMIVLSVSSIPPICMFFPKLDVISMMISNNLFMESIVSLIVSLFTMHIYIKFMVSLNL